MNKKIGVIDSGIGGLTTVKALQMLLPGEDIVYFGDNKNMPYGNRSGEEILELTMNILRFMEKQNVKIVGIACNTISSLIDRFKNEFDFPIIDIITPTVDSIIKMDTYSISIIGTEFTVTSGLYQKLLLEKNPDISITAEGSKTLAALIDAGKFDNPETRQVISLHINNLIGKGDLYNLILGCTHFPIVENVFRDVAPHLNLINPGFIQAKAIREYLHNNNLLKDTDNGTFEIFTSGETDIYNKVIERLNLKNVKNIIKV